MNFTPGPNRKHINSDGICAHCIYRSSSHRRRNDIGEPELLNRSENPKFSGDGVTAVFQLAELDITTVNSVKSWRSCANC